MDITLNLMINHVINALINVKPVNQKMYALLVVMVFTLKMINVYNVLILVKLVKMKVNTVTLVYKKIREYHLQLVAV